MKLTFDEAVENHRKMWRWIAIQTLKKKRIVIKSEYIAAFNSQTILNNCFCCEYTVQFHTGLNCLYCPIEWNSYERFYNCERNRDSYGIYGRWYKTKNYKEAALLAYKISKLPARKKIYGE